MIRYVWTGLWERKVRTALTLVGVAVCVLAFATVDGMLGHMVIERDQDLARLADRVLLQPPGAGYPPFKSTLRADAVAAALRRPDIVADESTPLLFLVLAPPDNPMDVAGVIGLGLWPGHERAWLGAAPVISGQATLAGAGDDAVILGRQAARFYGVSAAGQSIAFAGRRWRVVGILREAGATKLDTLDNLVVLPLASAQAAFDAEGLISAVLLTAPPGTAAELARALAAEYSALHVNTQEDIRQVLLKEMEMPTKFLGVVSWTAFAVAVLLIANVMLIAIHERLQETERIRAIGERRLAIPGHILTETLALSLGGGALGALAAVPTAYAFGWTWILTGGELLRVVGLALAAGLLAGVYPAYRAARAYPQALRYDELRRQMEEVTAERRAIGRAYHQLVRGREEERERLARDLHDQAIQSLVGLKFHLADRATPPAALQAEIDGVIETLRELCADLRPPALDRLGLVAALRSYADDFSARTGLPTTLRVAGPERRLPSEVELALFRVAQEALTNAWKHAQAPAVEVELRFAAEGVELSVRDRGRGFAVPERLGALVEAGHFGLVNMHERMALVGGALRLTAAPGQGTTVRASVPL